MTRDNLGHSKHRHSKAGQARTLSSYDGEPIRLVHVTTVPESLYFLRGQTAYLASRGIEVHAVSSPGQLLTRFAEHESARAWPVKMSRSVSPCRDLRALWIIFRLLCLIRPHIVHAHTPKAGLLATAAARLAGVPVRIYHIHGLPLLTASGARRALLRRTERSACSLATQVLCVSRSVRDVVVGEGLCESDRIRVLANGSINGVDAVGEFDPERTQWARSQTRVQYGIPSDATVIGFFGRIVRDKGIVELERAWRMLRQEQPGLHLLMVGPFEPQDPLPPEVEQALRTDSRVHLAGLHWQMPPFYAAADIVVLPSYREGFPSVPLEAAAMRLPVVATQVPGCVDAVCDGLTGTLVPPRDVPALADAVRAYAAEPQLRLKHGLAGRARVLRDFRPRDIWEETCALYCRLLRSAGCVMADEPAPEPIARTAAACDRKEGLNR